MALPGHPPTKTLLGENSCKQVSWGIPEMGQRERENRNESGKYYLSRNKKSPLGSPDMSVCPGLVLSFPLLVGEHQQHSSDLHLLLTHSCGKWGQGGHGSHRQGRLTANVCINQGIAFSIPITSGTQNSQSAKTKVNGCIMSHTSLLSLLPLPKFV